MAAASQMSNEEAQVAHELVERRRSGHAGARFDAALRPTSLAQALSIQQAVATLWCAGHGDDIGAWKAGMPVTHPDNPGELQKIVIAPIFASTISSITPALVWTGHSASTNMPVARIEPELAFVLAEDLPYRLQPYTRQEVQAAVGEVRMALELISCRYSEPAACDFAEKLADNLENQGLFLGPLVDRQLAFFASELSLTLTENGTTRTMKGRHPAGDAAAPLYWLAEFLRSRGEGLRAGQAVITGCYSEKVLEVGLNQCITLTYTSSDNRQLGRMDVQFQPKKEDATA
jgi:2-keto-4-pentenoate hydratase